MYMYMYVCVCVYAYIHLHKQIYMQHMQISAPHIYTSTSDIFDLSKSLTPIASFLPLYQFALCFCPRAARIRPRPHSPWRRSLPRHTAAKGHGKVLSGAWRTHSIGKKTHSRVRANFL